MSGKYIDIEKEDIDAWYELSWDNENKQLIVRMHILLEDQLSRLNLEAPLIRGLAMEKFSLDPFLPPSNQNWGFGGVMQNIPSVDPLFISWAIDLPRVVWEENSEKHYDWKSAYNISATLNALFTLLHVYEREEVVWQHPHRQLAIVDTLNTSSDFHGGALQVTFARALLPWLRSLPDDVNMSPITQAMITTYCYAFQDVKPDNWLRHSIYGRTKTVEGYRFIHFSCRGDACNLYPEMSYFRPGEKGYKLHPHNIDTPAQQLVFLVGIAAMCDLAREFLYPNQT